MTTKHEYADNYFVRLNPELIPQTTRVVVARANHGGDFEIKISPTNIAVIVSIRNKATNAESTPLHFSKTETEDLITLLEMALDASRLGERKDEE